MPGEVLRTARSVEPDGTEMVEEEWRDGPGWAALAPAPHHLGDTRYEVLHGLARVRIGRTDRVYRVGESVIVATGQSVTLEPVDGAGLHLLIQRWSHSAAPEQRPTQRGINHP